MIRPRRSPRIGPRAALALVAASALVGALLWSTLSSPPKPTPAGTPAAAPKPVPRVAQSLPPKTVAVHRHHPLVIRATSGPCWLLVRRGGLSGPVLYEGTLAQGASMQFKPRVWVRLGAPWNVDMHRGSRVVGGLSGAMPLNITA